MSLTTWLEARRLTKVLGGRFILRIHAYVLSFLVVSLFLLVSLIAFLAGYVPQDLLTHEGVAALVVYTLVLNFYVLQVMLVASRHNVKTLDQIKRLINIREQIKRIVVEPTYMRMNPSTVPIRIQQLVL